MTTCEELIIQFITKDPFVVSKNCACFDFHLHISKKYLQEDHEGKKYNLILLSNLKLGPFAFLEAREVVYCRRLIVNKIHFLKFNIRKKL